MDEANLLGEFLRARRELVRPEDVGLQVAGRRRVAGLRREELALLAGVSVDYLVRLEQGRDRHPSRPILDALAQVLRLDESAVRHLHTLAYPPVRPRRSRPRPERASPGLLRLMECWTSTPAFVVGRFLDVLACNPLMSAVHRGMREGENVLRLVFLDRSNDCYADWDRVADDTVASLRSSIGADLDHPRLIEIVGELSVKSEEFRRRWVRHDVREKTGGHKRYKNPIVGELALDYEAFTINGAPGQMLAVYHAPAGSEAERGLARLAALIGAANVPPEVAGMEPALPSIAPVARGQ